MWEMKPRTTRQKTCRLFMGPEGVTGSNTLQAVQWYIGKRPMLGARVDNNVIKVYNFHKDYFNIDLI